MRGCRVAELNRRVPTLGRPPQTHNEAQRKLANPDRFIYSVRHKGRHINLRISITAKSDGERGDGRG